MTLRDRFFLLRELVPDYYAERNRYLAQEFLWNNLIDDKYSGRNKEVVLHFILAESLRGVRAGGVERERSDRVIDAVLTHYANEIKVEQLTSKAKRELGRWPGLARYSFIQRKISNSGAK